jgi:ubiquinone/menaquinone biosynthesis C-methylase UbiE
MSQHLLELHRFVLSEIRGLVRERVLDVGCGRGVWGYLIREACDSICIVGIDTYKPHLNFCKRHRVYDDVILADVRSLPIKNDSFDVALCCEVIEHLTKNEGLKLLNEIERIGKKIIITTPNGYRPTGKIAVELETHRSGWNPSYFKTRGYRVKGVGFRNLKDAEASSFWWVWGFLFYFFTPIAYVFPWISGWLIAVKRQESKKV